MILNNIFNPSPVFSDITDNGLSASQAVMTDANKKLVSADYLNQAVKTTSNPTFAGLSVSNITDTYIPFATTGGLFTSSANLTFASNILSLTGTLSFPGTYANYSVSNQVLNGQNELVFQNKTSGKDNVFLVLSNDLDGTDQVGCRLISKGNPEVDDLRCIWRWDPSNSDWRLFSSRAGTTYTTSPMRFYVAPYTSQLVLNADGTINMSSILDVATYSCGGNTGVTGVYTVGNRITPVTGNLGQITVWGGIITSVQQAT